MSSWNFEGTACIMKHAYTKAVSVHTEVLADDLKALRNHVAGNIFLYSAPRFDTILLCAGRVSRFIPPAMAQDKV